MACLSAHEVHNTPGDPQDKLHFLKTIINTKRKHQEPFRNSPENLDSRGKSHFWRAARFLHKEHNAKRINSFGLMLKKFWLFEPLWKKEI